MISGDDVSTGTVTVDTTGNLSVSGHLNAGSYTGIESVGSTLGGADAGNYSFAGATGNYNVAQANLTITANNGTKTAGTVYTFGDGYTVTGLVPGDSVTGVTLDSLGAPAPAPVGTYPIIPSGATGPGIGGSFEFEKVISSGNYNITYVNGVLTVGAKPVTVSAPLVQIDPLGRPIISVADKVLNYSPSFEARETHTLNVDVSIKGVGVNGRGRGAANANALANLEPAAGGDDTDTTAKGLANIEPAAGGNGSRGPANSNFACAESFLDGKDCVTQ